MSGGMGGRRWPPGDLDRLERAIVERSRVRIVRRGTEYVVLLESLEGNGREETLFATHPGTGEEIRFVLGEIDDFSVLT